ncbi:MAG: MATE family efflux transporter [Anaerolineae bacterium]|nr:MATE family efflux transporter [Anaerolineae bacterium]
MSDFAEPKLKRILNIALPIVVSRASYTVMLFVNRLFLSRVGKYELAAVMSGGLTSLVLSSFFEGLVGYVTALVAQYYGAGRHKMCTRATTQAIYLALAGYPIMLCFMPLIKYAFVLTGQDPALAALATAYARMLLAGSILVILRTALGSFFVGIGKTRIILVANVSSVFTSVPLNYIFIFGKLGMPEMGIQGAALGTICGSVLALAVLIGCYLRETSRDPYKVPDAWRYMPDIAKRLLRFGLPAGIEPFLSWFAFNVFVQIMHSFGPDTAAAATIAFNWDAVAFVPMLGLGVATTTIIGQHIGAKDYDGAQRSVYLTLRIALIYSAAMIALFVGFAGSLTLIFSSGFEDADGQIAKMATTMLRLLALYTIANSSKLVLSGALRAAGDTAWVMRVAIALQWAMAVATIVLVRVVDVHQYVAWSTLTITNNAVGMITFHRFRSGKWRKMALIG